MQESRPFQPVSISRFGTGTSIISNTQTEGVEADFGNIKGFVSKTEFWKLLKARSDATNGSHVDVPPAPRNPQILP